MQILGSFDLGGNVLKNLRLTDDTEFPTVAKIGHIAMINRRIAYCMDISGTDEDPVPFWIPISQQLNMYRHYQTISAKYWAVEHNMGVATPLIQCYDASGDPIMPDNITAVDENNLIVAFNKSITGMAVLMTGNEYGVAAEKPVITQTFVAATSWSLTHNLGYVPTVRVYSGGKEVQATVTVDETTVTVSFGITSVAGTLMLF